MGCLLTGLGEGRPISVQVLRKVRTGAYLYLRSMAAHCDSFHDNHTHWYLFLSFLGANYLIPFRGSRACSFFYIFHGYSVEGDTNARPAELD